MMWNLVLYVCAGNIALYLGEGMRGEGASLPLFCGGFSSSVASPVWG